MEKKIYLLRGTNTESYKEFKSRMISLAHKAVEYHDVKEIKVVLTEYAPPLLSIIPFKRKKVAVLSLKNGTINDMPELENAPGFAGVYHVTEAIPVAYSRNWEDGTRTPGICLLTLFRQKTSIDYNTFIDRWHNSHTPLSLKIHPLWNYNRNVVNEHDFSNKETWHGIVEEHFRANSDLLNPFKFFGKPHHIIQNMIKVFSDTKSFIDYKTIEPYLAMEYHVKS